jgi:hypothetical protein
MYIRFLCSIPCQWPPSCLYVYGGTIDIKRKNRFLKVCYVPTTSATFLAFFLFFLLWPLTVLMEQTRQAVRAMKQYMLLRCLWVEPL